MDGSGLYSKRNSLRISGIPETENEDADTAVLHAAESMGVRISPSEIDISSAECYNVLYPLFKKNEYYIPLE